MDFREQATKPSPPPFAGRAADSEFRLTTVSGPAGTPAGQAASLDGGSPPRVYLGQATSCEIRVEDPRVSRRHAAIDLCGTHVLLTDLGSRNGTYVNGVLVVQARLQGGEVLKVGDTTLRFELVTAAQSLPSSSAGSLGRVHGASIEMRRLYSVLERVARSSSAVLIEGEAGTGKDLVAELIHESSPRASGPFVVVDCTAPDAEAAAFGPGGAFESAVGGTVVLDEIGALPFAGQAALAGALKNASEGAPRLVATSRGSLEEEVQAGRFREDLLTPFDRGRIELPPLRRRDGDVRYLAHHFWTQLGGTPDKFPFDLLEHMSSYQWPGNVRELETVLAQRLAGEDLPTAPAVPRASSPPSDVIEETLALDMPLVRARERVVQDFERRYLERALTKQNGNVLRAAAASGVARRYFQILRAKRFR